MHLRSLILFFMIYATQTAASEHNQHSPAEKPYWKGESVGVLIELSRKDIRAQHLENSEITLSLAERFAEQVKELEHQAARAGNTLPPGYPTEGMTAQHSETWSARSLVGPFLTLQREQQGWWPGAAHPQHSVEYVVYDLKNPDRVVKLVDLFREEDLVAALRADSLVKPALRGAEPRTLAELETALGSYNECRYSLAPGFANAFAFHGMRGDKVALRIGLTHGCGAARGALTQLGLLLPIPEALEHDLRLADQRKAGFLMRDLKKILGDQTTHFEWSRYLGPKISKR